ncbi:GFA family protein [Thioclava sp. FR2]|uniref:GFA family protein n=1 Tax=Thioclava sp. FR2 TaxID=3445780 RepID=UPI003EC065D9
MVTGGCLCGKVRFKTQSPLRDVVYCHCEQCRRQTGLYYAATAIPRADLVIEGAQNITWFAASDFARRGFCSNCGSALFWDGKNLPYVSVLAGAIDDPSQLVAECHIFTEHRPGFYSINDGLPEYPRSAPGLAVDE